MSPTPAAIELHLRPSLRALRWAFLLHVACIALLLAAQPPPLPLLGLGAAFAGSWLWVRRHPALGFGPRAWTRLLWHGDGGWTLERADGARVHAELRGDSIVRGTCLVLRFQKADGATTARLICGDELPAESLRRLRARLSAL